MVHVGKIKRIGKHVTVAMYTCTYSRNIRYAIGLELSAAT
jgi:hypothetical protein